MLMVFGLTKADIPDEIVEVYPDNWIAFIVFDGMSTQWRTGAVGATGLDYNVIPFVAKSCGVDDSETYEILPDIRVLESEALRVMIEERDK